MNCSQDILKAASRRLAAAGVETAQLDARYLLAFALGLRLGELGLSSRLDVGPEQQAIFETLLGRRCQREPLQRLIGHWDFWSLDLMMGEAGLIPRPDSETLIEAVIAHWPERSLPLQVLDLGTGTGCLLLALIAEYPNATGLGVDKNPDAVQLAAANAARLGFDARTRFQIGDWGQGLDGSFDLIVSNPPYIPSRQIDGLEPEVALYEPRLALDGGGDGLAAYRRIAVDLKRLLAPKGIAVLELGAGQAAEVSTLLGAAGLDLLGLHADLGGVERAILVENRG